MFPDKIRCLPIELAQLDDWHLGELLLIREGDSELNPTKTELMPLWKVLFLVKVSVT